MSTDSNKGIDSAIRAHSAKEWDGELVVDWVLVAATVDSDGDHSIGTVLSRSNMPMYIVEGLLRRGITLNVEGDDL